jgi:hypothetical protein
MNVRYQPLFVLAAINAILCSLMAHPCVAQQQSADANKDWGQVRLESSDQRLVAGFDWAKQQALAYVFTGDPVGNWYEAALPGRSAFCMRDVSHQSIGAQVLGLAAFNRSMLHKFAASISESRGWCGYWEINKDDKPAPADYKDDQDFWFNLPANFDVVNTCYQAYQWTGDATYLNDPIFLNFYQRTLNDYIRYWDKDENGIPEGSPEYGHRGIGSYDEDSRIHIKIGSDLIAAEYAAYLAYANILELRHVSAQAATLRAKAAALRQSFNKNWWNHQLRAFNSAILSDGTMYFARTASSAPLWFGLIVPGEKLQHELKLVTNLNPSVASSQQGGKQNESVKTATELTQLLAVPGVEEMSYLPEVAYRYGEDECGYAALLALTDPALKRREYPEVSFSAIRTVAVGAMGIDPDASNRVVKTRSHLTADTPFAMLENVPVFDNQISVTHKGLVESTFIIQAGPSVEWKAAFAGTFGTLWVNGKSTAAQIEPDLAGNPESFVIVHVETGHKITATTRSVGAKP